MDTDKPHELVDHELVNDLASAYRGKRMRDSIRDMEMAGVSEDVAETVYDAVGQHADEVRGELHRMLEESEMNGESMKDRVANRYVQSLQAAGPKDTIEKGKKLIQKFVATLPKLTKKYEKLLGPSAALKTRVVFEDDSRFEVEAQNFDVKARLSVSSREGKVAANLSVGVGREYDAYTDFNIDLSDLRLAFIKFSGFLISVWDKKVVAKQQRDAEEAQTNRNKELEKKLSVKYKAALEKEGARVERECQALGLPCTTEVSIAGYPITYWTLTIQVGRQIWTIHIYGPYGEGLMDVVRKWQPKYGGQSDYLNAEKKVPADKALAVVSDFMDKTLTSIKAKASWILEDR